jgi:hypothetical protein
MLTRILVGASRVLERTTPQLVVECLCLMRCRVVPSWSPVHGRTMSDDIYGGNSRSRRFRLHGSWVGECIGSCFVLGVRDGDLRPCYDSWGLRDRGIYAVLHRRRRLARMASHFALRFRRAASVI